MRVAPFLEAIGQYTSGIFAGSALYISLVQAPSLAKACNNTEIITHFQSFLPGAARMQGSLTVISALSLIGSYFYTSNRLNLTAGILMGAIFPYTVALIMPINNQFLNATAASATSKSFTALFATWSHLHSYRTLASMLAFAITTFKQFV